jgi:hypothetical protein
MASFTDQISTFNPYVSKAPLIEAMVTVGTQKQQQYDQGVQKIQGYVDNIAGMDVVNDADKKYLQSKLNDLGSRLKTVAAGDFSNQQLVNSVGGMATQVIKDPTVQNAVYSTANYRKELAKLQKDVDEGKSSPANVDFFNKKANSWLSSDKAGQKFSAGYIPYFDVQKFAKETFDSIKPDNFTTDMVYETDANGNIKVDEKGKPIYSPVMKRLEQEGRFPEKVKQTIEQIFSDSRVGQQLDISGQYEYRGYSPEMLTQKINLQKENIISKYDNAIEELALQKGTGKNVQAQIDQLELKKNNVRSQYDEIVSVAQDNPDAVRSLLYKDDVKSRFTTMFGEMKTKELSMANPGAEYNFKLQQEAQDQRNFVTEMNFKMTSLKTSVEEKAKDRALQVLLSKSKGGKGTRVSSDGTVITDDGFEEADKPGDRDIVYGFESELGDAANNYINASDNFIWSAALSKVPANQATYNSMLANGRNPDEAIKTIIDTLAAKTKETPEAFRARFGNKTDIAYNNMNAKERENNPDLQDAYELYKATKTNYSVLNAVKSKALQDAQAKSPNKNVSQEFLLDGIKSVGGIVNGKPVVATPDDLYDIAVYLKGNSSSLGFLNDKTAREAAKRAETRLNEKGKGDLLSLALLQYGDAPDLATGLTRSAKMYGNIAVNSLGGIPGVPGVGAIPKIDLSQVNKIVNKFGDDYGSTLKLQAEALKKYYYERPSLKKGLITGDASDDKVTVDDLVRFAGDYNTKGKNSSADFDGFVNNVGGKDVTYEAQISPMSGDKPMVEIVAYGGDGVSRLGGMVISQNEATRLNIDYSTLFEPQDITNLKMYIQATGDKTSIGDPKEKQTYLSGDAYFEKNSFKNLSKNSVYDAKANISYKNGLYYPHIFVTDGVNSGIKNLPGMPDIRTIINGFNGVNPQFIQALLTQQ